MPFLDLEPHPLELPQPHRLHALQLPVAAPDVMVRLVDEDGDDILVHSLGSEPESKVQCLTRG